MKRIIYPIGTVLLIILMWVLSSQKAIPQKLEKKITLVKNIPVSWDADNDCKLFIIEKASQGYKLIDFEPYHDGSSSSTGFIIVMEK
jgi:hypothetical protein